MDTDTWNSKPPSDARANLPIYVPCLYMIFLWALPTATFCVRSLLWTVLVWVKLPVPPVLVCLVTPLPTNRLSLVLMSAFVLSSLRFVAARPSVSIRLKLPSSVSPAPLSTLVPIMLQMTASVTEAPRLLWTVLVNPPWNVLNVLRLTLFLLPKAVTPPINPLHVSLMPLRPLQENMSGP